ncbi:MAG: hypothetical protein WDW38_007311 [Sanguina aurantia]
MSLTEELSNLALPATSEDAAAPKVVVDVRAAKKAERAAARGVKQVVVTQPEESDPLASMYGDHALIQSSEVTNRKWTDVHTLTAASQGEKVLLRGRVHAVRGKGKSAFLVIRQRTSTLQVVMFANDTTISKGMVKYASALTKESIIDVEGVIVCPERPVESCSQTEVELHVTSIRCISRAALLPFEMIDASRSEEDIKAAAERGEVLPSVSQDVRLDNRVVDLRTPANQAIFKIQSATCQVLLSEGFQEIHTPKLLAGASEGGAAVFHVDYMGTPACLAQSPQFYKQMAICADMERVFEIAPVFRAEMSLTYRHLCEFMGLDFEMTIHDHYFEVLDVIEKVFQFIFEGLATTCAGDLKVIAQQYPFEPAVFKPLRLTFPEGIKLLHENGFPDVDPPGGPEHGDFFILHRYPLAVRPFYTMPCPDDPLYSNSYDVFIRGNEIISGAQRVHDPELLVERAGACAGVGLERVVMLYCGLNNIRKTSMFPRDPKRLTP